jgi:hypothetical protein
MSELLSAISAVAAVDSHEMAAPALLVSVEEILAAQRQLDAVLARRLQAMDARDVTVDECGRHLRAWLVEEEFLSPDEAGRLTSDWQQVAEPELIEAARCVDPVSLGRLCRVLRWS